MYNDLNIFNTKHKTNFLKQIQQKSLKQTKQAERNKNILKIQSQIRRHLSNKRHITPFMIESGSKLQSLSLNRSKYQKPKFNKMMINALNKMPFIFQNIAFLTPDNFKMYTLFIRYFVKLTTDDKWEIIEYLMNKEENEGQIHLFVKIVGYAIGTMDVNLDLFFKEWIVRFIEIVGERGMERVLEGVVKEYSYRNICELCSKWELGQRSKGMLVEKIIEKQINSDTPFNIQRENQNNRNKYKTQQPNVSFIQIFHQNPYATSKYLQTLTKIATVYLSDQSSIQSQLQHLSPSQLYFHLSISFKLIEELSDWNPNQIDQTNLILLFHKHLLQKYVEKMIKSIKKEVFKKKHIVETAENQGEIKQLVVGSIQYTQFIKTIIHPIYTTQLFKLFNLIFQSYSQFSQSVLQPTHHSSYLSSTRTQSPQLSLLIHSVSSIYIQLVSLYPTSCITFISSRQSIFLLHTYLLSNKIKLIFVDQKLPTSKLIHLYLSILNRYFSHLDDFQFVNPSSSFSKQFIIDLVKSLYKIIMFFINKKQSSKVIENIFEICTGLMGDLYNKNSRTQYFDNVIFTGQDAMEETSYSLLKINTRYKEMLPFIIFPFNVRYLSLRELIQEFTENFIYVYIPVEIRRGHEFIDAFQQLNHKDMRSRLRVHFIQSIENGIKIFEEGIDAGGLTKQFLNRVLLDAFRPNKGLFVELEQTKQMMPNPRYQLHWKSYYQFIGKLIAKAILNQSLIPIKFSNCFLNLFLGKKNTIEDLKFIDKSMYETLMKIKHSWIDVDEMELTFSYIDGKDLVLLKQNGDKIPVNKENKMEFIDLLSDYKTNKLYFSQSYWVRKGFQTVIPADCFLKFNFEELNMIMSGRLVQFDIKDFKMNAKVQGYERDDPTMLYFWKLIEEMSNRERLDLLKFTTACERPPLLGFSDLKPKFTIKKLMNKNTETEGDNIMERLPNASTCVNTLYIPDYQDYDTLKKKVLYAIQENVGFGNG